MRPLLIIFFFLPSIVYSQTATQPAHPNHPAPSAPAVQLPPSPQPVQQTPPPLPGKTKELTTAALAANPDLDITFKNCFVEIQKYCKKDETEVVPLRACLSQHSATIKGLCSRHIAQYSSPSDPNVSKICEKEIAELCPGAQPDGARIIKCLKDNLAKTAGDCHSFIQKN